MFKKNPNRPPITISLKKVSNGYKVLNNDSFNPFCFKRITRAIFRSDLYQGNHQNGQGNFSGMAQNASIVQPPLHLTIPHFSKWFDMDHIHQIEKQEFPQFFLQEDEEDKLFRKSPKLYKLYRNYIISLWRENSKKYLSPAICRRNLSGDVSCIIRIHAFLEHWGLINFPSKQHAKGTLQSRPKNYYCLICEEMDASQYYITEIEDGAIMQICNCCYYAKYYPNYLKPENFRKIIPDVHEKKKKKMMSPQEIKKMLQIINNDTQRERQMWANLAKQLPNYTKEEIMKNFLEIPGLYSMNGNIFESNEDIIPDVEPNQNEEPTVFQDYENPMQSAIAIAYFSWKKYPEKYPELQKLFIASQKHSNYLAQIQKLKVNEMIRMLTDLEESKIQLKTIFLQQCEKLIKGEKKSFQAISSNLLAESIKTQEAQQEQQ